MKHDLFLWCKSIRPQIIRTFQQGFSYFSPQTTAPGLPEMLVEKNANSHLHPRSTALEPLAPETTVCIFHKFPCAVLAHTKVWGQLTQMVWGLFYMVSPTNKSMGMHGFTCPLSQCSLRARNREQQCKALGNDSLPVNSSVKTIFLDLREILFSLI